jgi:hypothetical protein
MRPVLSLQLIKLIKRSHMQNMTRLSLGYPEVTSSILVGGINFHFLFLDFSLPFVGLNCPRSPSIAVLMQGSQSGYECGSEPTNYLMKQSLGPV